MFVKMLIENKDNILKQLLHKNFFISFVQLNRHVVWHEYLKSSLSIRDVKADIPLLSLMWSVPGEPCALNVILLKKVKSVWLVSTYKKKLT